MSDQVNVWWKITSRIVKYGFGIEYRDLEPPRTGIFNGLRIVIDPDVGFEMQCFPVAAPLRPFRPVGCALARSESCTSCSTRPIRPCS
jgi:hypothetical protein